MFSFILPAYKGRYLKESIDSILAQDYKNFELIIVDDCSPDNLQDIISKYNDPRISFYRNEKNIGGIDLVAQWNHCLDYATGDYTILATDDDLYEPNFLSSFVPLIRKYPKVQVFRSRILEIDHNGKLLWFDRCYKEYLNQGEFYYYFFQGMKGGIPQYIFKRDILISKGGFVSLPLAWGSDDATALLLSEQGIVNSQDMLVRFRWSDANISSDKGRHSKNKKIDARINLCKWLKREIPNIKFGDTDIEQYCQKYVLNNFDVHIKQILLKELIPSHKRDFICNLQKIYHERIISNKDILSIIYQYIKNIII